MKETKEKPILDPSTPLNPAIRALYKRKATEKQETRSSRKALEARVKCEKIVHEVNMLPAVKAAGAALRKANQLERAAKANQADAYNEMLKLLGTTAGIDSDAGTFICWGNRTGRSPGSIQGIEDYRKRYLDEIAAERLAEIKGRDIASRTESLEFEAKLSIAPTVAHAEALLASL